MNDAAASIVAKLPVGKLPEETSSIERERERLHKRPSQWQVLASADICLRGPAKAATV